MDFDLDNQIYNQVEVRGLKAANIPPGDYRFRIALVLDDGCVEDSNVNIDLTINSDVDFTLLT